MGTAPFLPPHAGHKPPEDSAHRKRGHHYYSGQLDARKAKEREDRGKDKGPEVLKATLPKKASGRAEHPSTITVWGVVARLRLCGQMV